MNLLPRTLSRSFRNEIGPVRSCDDLIFALKKEPENLLKFLLQASSSLIYLKDNKKIVTCVWLEITKLGLSGTLSWGSIEKTYYQVCHLISFWVTLFNDLTVTFNGKAYSYSRFVFLIESKLFRERWKERPEEINVPMCSLTARLASIEAFDLFYHVLVYRDFQILEKTSIHEIMELILQAEECGCESLYTDLQTYLCTKIYGFKIPLSILPIAIMRGFKMVEKKCRTRLDEAIFFKDLVEGVYQNYTLSCLNRSFLNLFSEPDQQKLNEDYFWNIEHVKKCEWLFDLEWLTIIMESRTDALICYGQTRREEDILKLKSKIQFPQLCLNRKNVKKVTFNQEYKLPDSEIIGILLYFDHVEEAQFVEYKLIDKTILSLIRDLKINLKRIHFSKCNLNEANFIQLLSLKSLSKLSLSEENISQYIFEIIMSMNHLDAIDFQGCVFSLYDQFSCNRHDLRELSLSDIKTLSRASLKTIFSLFPKLTRLNVAGCASFCLSDYPYPSNLEELTLSFQQLEQELGLDGNLPSIDRLINLKKLTLIGKCPGALKPVILRYIQKFKIVMRPS